MKNTSLDKQPDAQSVAQVDNRSDTYSDAQPVTPAGTQIDAQADTLSYTQADAQADTLPLIIAEIGTGGNKSFDDAKRLIDAAKASGAGAVKMQWVYASEILHPKTGKVFLPSGSTKLYDEFLHLEQKKEFYGKCRAYAKEIGIKYICSPFGEKSLEELISLAPDAIKIASPELNYTQLLKSAAEKRGGIPLILSTGVSKLCDIERALEIVGRNGVTLLHCVTSYPAPSEDYNLRLIKNLQAIFGTPTGVSDHSSSPVIVPALATLMEAAIIEKHFTLSHEGGGLDDKIALTAEDFSLMVHAVTQTAAALRHYGAEVAFQKVTAQLSDAYGERLIRATLGDGVKRLSPSETQNYSRTNRSLHYLHSLPQGALISEKDIAALRTEKVLSVGLPPSAFPTLIGHHTTRPVQSGEGVQWEDFLG